MPRLTLATVLCFATVAAASCSNPQAHSPERIQIAETRPAAQPPVSHEAASSGRSAPEAPVAVAIVIDQLASWVASERLPKLPEAGGFARLRREGTWVTDMAYLHAATETAPGHASLFTGRTPRETRIVGNAVWRADLNKQGSQLEDPNEHAVGPSGVDTSRNGVSLAALRGPTLADALRERDPKALIVSLSLKDRGAAYMGGRSPDAALWYDDKSGNLMSSTAFTRDGQLPAFARPYLHPVASLSAQRSELQLDLLDAAFVSAHARTPDDQVGELELHGRVFPHRIASPNLLTGYRLLPASDDLLIDLALAALPLRKPEHPTLIALSFSAYDYVGHAFGPDSWEAWNHLLALDKALARLFTALDERLGQNGYSVVLSADHGIGSLPEVVSARQPAHCLSSFTDPYQRPCIAGKRINSAALATELNQGLSRLLPKAGRLVQAVADSRVVLTPDAHALHAVERQLLEGEIRTLLAASPSVSSVAALTRAAQTCPPPEDESIAALVCRSHTEAAAGYAAVAGDYYIVLRPGHFWDGAGPAMHGSPYRYDRTVPLLVRYAATQNAPPERQIERTQFGSFHASLWYALTGERVETAYGQVVGAPER